MIQDRHRFRLLLAGLAALALLLASCGSSGSDDAKKDDTTTTAASGSDDDASTTTEAKGSDGPTTEDVEALLPTAADLGEGWKVDSASEDDESDESDKVIEEQCPEASALASDNEDDSDEVKRSFTDDASRQIEVKVSPSAEEVESTDLDALADAINACDPITIPSAGATTTMDLEAEVSEDYGDQAIQMHAAVSITADGLPEPVALNIYVLLFRNGPVGVQITASDGFDESTLAVTEADTDLLTSLATDLDEASAELAGS